MKLNKGTVVLCKVPLPSEMLGKFKMRPGLVVSKNLNNARLDDVIIATCTSNVSRNYEPTQYLIEGFTGIGHSIEDWVYKAKWGMREPVALLKQQGMLVPRPKRSPKITIKNEKLKHPLV